MNDININNSNLNNPESTSPMNSKFWCFMCEQEFFKTISGPSEVFCPQCGGISELIEENNDPRQFQAETSTSSVNPQSQPNMLNINNTQNQSATQSQQNPTRRNVAIISNVRETPFGRVVIQTVIPGGTEGPETQGTNVPTLNPFGALLNPIFSFLGGNPMMDLDSRIIEEFLRNDPNRHGPPPASQDAVNKLKETKYSEGVCKTKECTVCQEDYQNEDSILHLPCEHNFHKACVTEWLLRHNSCPICRKGLQGQEQEQGQNTAQTSDL